jgi:hypothetical protein
LAGQRRGANLAADKIEVANAIEVGVIGDTGCVSLRSKSSAK